MARILTGVSESSLTDLYSYRDDDLVERVRRSYAENERYSSRFRERIRDTHEELRSERLYRMATSASRKLRNIRREDRIEQLTSIGAMQHAKDKMREAITSSRIVRKAARAGLIDGYSDHITWTEARANPHTGMLARQLNNGLIERHEDGVYRSVRYYMSDDRKKELSSFDRGEAILTRRTVERMIMKGKGEDPTSPYNACLTAFYP